MLEMCSKKTRIAFISDIGGICAIGCVYKNVMQNGTIAK